MSGVVIKYFLKLPSRKIRPIAGTKIVDSEIDFETMIEGSERVSVGAQIVLKLASRLTPRGMSVIGDPDRCRSLTLVTEVAPSDRERSFDHKLAIGPENSGDTNHRRDLNSQAIIRILEGRRFHSGPAAVWGPDGGNLLNRSTLRLPGNACHRRALSALLTHGRFPGQTASGGKPSHGRRLLQESPAPLE